MAHGRQRRGRDKRATVPGRFLTARCPDPCGKLRFLSRADAKQAAASIRGRGGGAKLRVYEGHEGTCCEGFWHHASYIPADRLTYFRERGQ